MTPRLVRRFVLAVCAAGIAGMIVGSARGDNGLALTFGLVTAAAIACLMVATAVGGAPARADSDAAARVEELSRQLVDAGAPESTVGELVREAGKLGRERRSLRPSPAQDPADREEAGAGVHGGRTPSPSAETFT
ncbi:MAG: hypothetical protein M3Z84_04310 [Actinomycetota bacterium]|nr:hypothetical protein [Actinomycetota bacterium]